MVIIFRDKMKFCLNFGALTITAVCDGNYRFPNIGLVRGGFRVVIIRRVKTYYRK